jgi:hypothetical protein
MGRGGRLCAGIILEKKSNAAAKIQYVSRLCMNLSLSACKITTIFAIFANCVLEEISV